MSKREEVKVTYHGNGRKEEETHYKYGKKHGRWTRWSECGHKILEMEYVRGKRIGGYIYSHKTDGDGDWQLQGVTIFESEEGTKMPKGEYMGVKHYGTFSEEESEKVNLYGMNEVESEVWKHKAYRILEEVRK
jgi:antitoxin component YwqK of YwqJK toxin-antitoxin module